jgi:hypothetical protein
LLVTALAFTLALALAIAWAALGRSVWWIPAFALSFAGGHFTAGFKIYPHEIGIALSLIALGALLAFHTPRRQDRPHLDWSLYALPVYMLVHLAVSCSLALAAGSEGTGTIVRLYANGLWAVGFAVLFWTYGNLRHFRTALVLATVFCVLRVAMARSALVHPTPARCSPQPYLCRPTALTCGSRRSF